MPKLKIVIGNVESQIQGPVDFNTSKAIGSSLSYMPDFAVWSPKYRSGQWDGLLNLWDWKRKTFPSGCLSRVASYITDHLGFEVVIDDQRDKPPRRREYVFNNTDPGDPTVPLNLFYFQEEAIKIAEKRTRGIFSFPTGTGKTITFTAIIANLKVSPVLVFVPTRDLLYQTKTVIENMITEYGKPVSVGIIGDGHVDIFDKDGTPKPIIVCIINSALCAYNLRYDPNKQKVIEDTRRRVGKEEQKELSPIQANRESIQWLIENAPCIIADEAHRCASDMWKTILGKCKGAYYRLAFSATPYREDGRDLEIESAFGKILIDMTLRRAIDEGFLVEPEIYFAKIYYDPEGAEFTRIYEEVDLDTGDVVQKETTQWVAIEDWSPKDVYKMLVVRNEELNNKIAAYTTKFNEEGLSVLILIGEKEHGRTLEEMIEGSVFACSDTPMKLRRQLVQDLKDKKLLTIIATSIANTGLDVPSLDVIILAAGGGREPDTSSRTKIPSINKETQEFLAINNGPTKKRQTLQDVASDDSGIFEQEFGSERKYGAVILQSIGRALRSNRGRKTRAIIIDFDYVCRRMWKGSRVRKKIYTREGLKYKVIK